MIRNSSERKDLTKMSKTKQRKSTAGKSIAVFFIVFIILEGLIIFGLKSVFKTEDSVPTFGGYGFFLMDSDNMSPSVPKNTLVISVIGTPGADKISNAVLCKNVGDEGTTVAWLNEIGSKGDKVNGVVYTVLQDNVSGADSEGGVRYYDVESSDVIGVATSHYITAGKIISFVITPFGIAICLAVPLVMLVLLELVVAVTNRSDDDSYEPEDYGRDERYDGMRQSRRDGQQSGNVALDDFLYGGNGDDGYGNMKPHADYAEEFDTGRPAPAHPQRSGGRSQQQPQQQQQAGGRPDFNFGSGNAPRPDFDNYDEDGYANYGDGYTGEPTAEGNDRGYADDGFAQNGYGNGQETAENQQFADNYDDEEVTQVGDDLDEDDFFEQPTASEPAAADYYDSRASRAADGGNYQPQPVPQPEPQTVQLEKPKAPAPAPAPAPVRTERQQTSAPRRRPSQSQSSSAQRRRTSGSAPSRQSRQNVSSGQQRRRPPQQRLSQQRRASHRDANAALANLMKKINDEQSKLGDKK